MGDKEFLESLTIPNKERFKIINGYIIPSVGCLATISNILVVLIYIKQLRKTRSQIRKVSSILYVAIATTNILLSLPVSIVYAYIFTHKNLTYFVPYELCSLWMYMLSLVYTPHIASLLYVTLLSLQRYTVIRHPFTSADKWTCKKTVVYVFVIAILSIAIQFPSAVDFSLTPKKLNTIILNSTDDVTCSIVYQDWTGDHPEIVDSIINSIIFVLCIVLPCGVISTCNILLLRFLNKSKLFNTDTNEQPSDSFKFQKQEFKSNQRPDLVHQQVSMTSQQEKKDHRHQNLLVLVFSFIVIVVHVPYSIIMSLYIYSVATKNQQFIKLFNVSFIRNIIDLTIHLNHPLLFILSCVLSQRFRYLLAQFWKCSRAGNVTHRNNERTVIQEAYLKTRKTVSNAHQMTPLPPIPR